MIEDAGTIFGIVGIIIFIGFFGALLFVRTRIPDILILISVGLFLGLVLTSFWHYELIPQKILLRIAPLFAALALMIILFDGGLELNFDKVLGQLGSTFALTISTFTVSMLTTAIISVGYLKWDVINGLMFGAIIGGTSGAIVVPLVNKMKISDEAKTILTLESVITDVLCVIVVISLIEIKLAGGTDFTIALKRLASAFSIAIVTGLLFGILWLKVLKALYGKPYSFMITIAALFLLYAMTEKLTGSGAMAALVFGFVLSNRTEITRIFKMKSEFVFDDKIKQFQSELSFFIRTFFFVYLGLMFTIPSYRDKTFFIFLLASILIFMALLIGRSVTVKYTTVVYPAVKRDRSVMWIMLPRGLAAAVLASMPFTMGLPGTEPFMNYAFMIILFTVCAATIGTFVTERGKIKNEKLNVEKQDIKKTELNKKEQTQRS